MTDVIQAEGGTIDKFEGDAIIAFWNAPLEDPDQYENAARASLGMIEKLEQLNREMPDRKGEPWPGEITSALPSARR